MENDINRDISIDQIDYNIDINDNTYTIEINPQNEYVINLNEQGPQGTRGPQGEPGVDAAITGVTASVDDTVGTPSVSVTMGGTSASRTFDFAFHNLKGDKGDTGATGSTGPAGTDATIVGATATVDSNVGTPSVSVTVGGTESARTFDFAFHNLKGADGACSVTSVNGQTGTVVLSATDVGALPSTTTIGDGALTIQRNGNAIGTFTANATSGTTVNISVPTTATEVGALPDTTTIGAGNTTIQVNGTSIGTINANQTSDNSINIEPNTILAWVTPDYANGINVAATSDSEQTYTAPSTGWFNFNLWSQGYTIFAYVKVNDVYAVNGDNYGSSSTAYTNITGSIFVAKDDVIKFRTSKSASSWGNHNYFYPAKGGN